MQSKAFFKIIVPNYNNMAYVKICLDSILKQTFQDFKIVFVDDWSDDFSFEFAQACQRQYPDKIVALKAPKKGQAGQARNIGLDYPVDSEYTWFIDSDDWMTDKDVLLTLHQLAVKNDYPDIIRCPLLHYYGRNNYRADVESADPDKLAVGGAGPSKNCIRSKKFSHIKFIEDRAQWNDVAWFLELLDNVDLKRIVVCDRPLYCYNRASVTSSSNSDVQFSQRCIEDMIKLHYDLDNVTYKHSYCNKERDRMISQSIAVEKHYVTLNTFVENSFVISIDTERHKLFQKFFSMNGFEDFPKLHVGHQDKNLSSTKNCQLSHLEIIRMAKETNLPFVVIFEDDAYPCNGIKQQLEDILRRVPQDANVILLGYSSCSERQKASMRSKSLCKIIDGTVSGAHAYILFEQAYDKYIKFFETNTSMPADNGIFFALNPTYVAREPLFIQYCKSKSMHNHFGYIFEGNWQNPPPRFPTVNKYITQ